MLELFQITNDPVFAARCDQLAGLRLFVDLERNGKAQRQAGRDTFISAHQNQDIDRVKAVLRHSRLMVRLNPLHSGSPEEVDDAIRRGADMLMLPMFRTAGELAAFCEIVALRVPVVPLLETREALASVQVWAGQRGIEEIFVGLNDLHLSLGCRFMFEPLAGGLLDEVAGIARIRGLRFGFGGIARMDEGLLSGEEVLAEHLRLGSGAVILSRTFHRGGPDSGFEDGIARLRDAERRLGQRSVGQIAADRERIRQQILDIARRMGGAGEAPV